ncbi:hypothetical protein BN1013_02230 [Candidatus Rubidus massiliensis]|nr:hypothetical protein BN1013_02230 [Candidatus Rubidus massiliensis]
MDPLTIRSGLLYFGIAMLMVLLFYGSWGYVSEKEKINHFLEEPQANYLYIEEDYNVDVSAMQYHINRVNSVTTTQVTIQKGTKPYSYLADAQEEMLLLKNYIDSHDGETPTNALQPPETISRENFTKIKIKSIVKPNQMSRL